jgi:outer membrane lipoprotein SlyB
MKRTLLVGVVSLWLVGCSTTQIQQAEAFLGQVQAYTAQVCKFVPTIATILAIVNGGIGSVVGAVGAAICNAVPPPSSARFKALPRLGSTFAGTVGTVNGIPITGWRVP